jgi:ABC-type spermidine/putrescine transport system permease subunit II
MSSPLKSLLRGTAPLPGETGRFAMGLSGFILLLAVLPILTMIVMSFSGASNLDFPPASYSLQWYKAAWNTFVSPDASDVLSLGQALTTSLLVATLSMLFATLVAVPAAYALVKTPRSRTSSETVGFCSGSVLTVSRILGRRRRRRSASRRLLRGIPGLAVSGHPRSAARG